MHYHATAKSNVLTLNNSGTPFIVLLLFVSFSYISLWSLNLMQLSSRMIIISLGTGISSIMDYNLAAQNNRNNEYFFLAYNLNKIQLQQKNGCFKWGSMNLKRIKCHLNMFWESFKNIFNGYLLIFHNQIMFLKNLNYYFISIPLPCLCFFLYIKWHIQDILLHCQKFNSDE